jgi:hypothetical protein
MSEVSSTVNLTINDLPVRVPDGTALIEAAQTLGIRVPISQNGVPKCSV